MIATLPYPNLCLLYSTLLPSQSSSQTLAPSLGSCRCSSLSDFLLLNCLIMLLGQTVQQDTGDTNTSTNTGLHRNRITEYQYTGHHDEDTFHGITYRQCDGVTLLRARYMNSLFK